MLDVFTILIGIGTLIIGAFIGNLMSRSTKEELEGGQPYFKLLAIIGLVGGIVGLIIGNDVLLFTMFFIAIVTAQSIEKPRSKKKSKKRK